MTLAQAILHILETAPRPVTADIVLDFLPGFYDGPELKFPDKSAGAHEDAGKNTQRTRQIRVVIATLERLHAVDEVVSIPHHHLGRLWKITPNGRAALV